MITPVFSVNQTRELIIIDIIAKYSKPSQAEILIDQELFVFNAKPFYLRLRFEQKLSGEEEQVKSTFDIETGTYTIRVPKLNPSEEFSNLNLLAKLLLPKNAPKPKIEIIGNKSDNDVMDNEEDTDDEEAIQNWEIEQTIAEDVDLIQNSTYGFGNGRSDIFQRLEEESTELFENYKISSVSNEKRRELRIQAENEKFDEEHYLADLFDPPEDLLNAHAYFGFWLNEADENKNLSKAEKEELVSMKSKILPLDQKQTRMVYSGLVEIIFAYAYISRSFQGDMSPESSWMIGRISPMLSWLDISTSPREGITNCYRRALMFPLFRSFSLCVAAHQDTVKLISNRIYVTKTLLHIKSLFNRREPFYLLNQLYIDDYIIWIQSRALDENLIKLANNLARFRVKPDSLNLDLELLERVAKLTMDENDDEGNENDVITMEEAMEKLGIELRENEFVSTYEESNDFKSDNNSNLNSGNNDNNAAKMKLIEEI